MTKTLPDRNTSVKCEEHFWFPAYLFDHIKGILFSIYHSFILLLISNSKVIILKLGSHEMFWKFSF